MTRISGFQSAALAAAVLVAFCVPAEAQLTAGGTSNLPLPPRQLTRGQLWHSYFNTGCDGFRGAGSVNYASSTYADLVYPSTTIRGGDDYSEYFGSRAAAYNHVEVDRHNGRGHAWWIATKVDGKEVVSWSSPLAKGREESDDVVLMQVDPTIDLGGRFASVGNPVSSPLTGTEMANWWPGSGLISPEEPIEILNYRYGQYNNVATDNFPEDIILSKWTTGTGITGEKAAYAWNHPEYDDLIIQEFIFENTGDSDGDRVADLPGGGHDLRNVYFAFHHRLCTSSAGASRGTQSGWFWDFGTGDACDGPNGPDGKDNLQDDKIKYTEAPNYDGPDWARGLKMNYVYDWDNFCYGGQIADDVGDPWRAELKQRLQSVPIYISNGDLLSQAWIGVAEIDVDPTDGFVGDDEIYVAPKVAQQPFAHNLFWFLFRQQTSAVSSDIHGDEPDPTKLSDEVLYQMVTRSPESSYFDSPRDSRPTRGSGPPGEGVPLLPLPDEPTEPMPYMPNPVWEWEGRRGIAAAYTVMDTYGPYDLAPGDKVKFVFAYVAGSPVEESFDSFSRLGDNSELRKEENGKAFENLVKHLRKAKEAYELGYDLPNQPPDVKTTLASSKNAQVEISWPDDADTSPNPDTGRPDVAGYKIYQSETIPGLWKEIGDVKVGDAQYYDAAAGTYTFEDPLSVSGFSYLYQVRAYQGSGNVGFVSRKTGRTVEGGVTAYTTGPSDPGTYYIPPGGSSGLSPVQVPSIEADRMERPIHIVPNPYIIDAVHTYEGSQKIRILNLPRRAKIRIFSVAGNMVAEEVHESDTVGEFGYFQINRTLTGPLTFGVYIVTVESMVPESMGQVQYAKFVIIR
jgi:hypothetical protein